jgi:hypothetical protein
MPNFSAVVVFSCQVAPSFLGVHYAGVNCGPTALTTLVHVEDHMLFYTVALPIAEALHDSGLPTIFWFVPSAAARYGDGGVDAQMLPSLQLPSPDYTIVDPVE